MKKLIVLLCLFASIFATAQTRIAYTPSTIVLNITDFEKSETILKRTATFSSMTYNQAANTLELIWVVKYYAVDSLGNYAAYMGDTFADKIKVFTATNNVMVNPANGQILTPDINGNYAIDYMGQYDFYNRVGDNLPIKLNDMIRQFGTTANWN